MTANSTQPHLSTVALHTAAPPIIRIRQLNKRYGKLHVLRDLDLDIAPAEKVSIIGPSGSGKSTVLRLLMTLERPDSGTIEIEGDPLWTMHRNDREIPADAAHIRKVRGKVGMVFQQFNLFPHMRVLKNVTLAPIRVLGLSKRDADERARDLLDKVGLADKLHAYPNQLSGGQKQRVAIARALAMQPKILLLDEVTSALDPELVGEVLNVLRRLATETDMTMLFVTHQMHFAREISDRVVFFDAGKILEARDPEGMFTDPKEDRTRVFLKSVLEAS